MHNINGYVYGNQPLGEAAGEGMTVRPASTSAGT